MPTKKCLIPTIVSIVVVVIVVIVLLATSIKSVEENHVAIIFDRWTQTIDESQVYRSGIHTIGPTKSFIEYPTTFVQLSLTGENTVVCRTKDGMLVSLPIQITYSYDTTQVIDLYKRFMDNFDEFLLNISSNTVRDTVNGFEAEDLQLNFEEIREQLRIDLNNAYKDIYLTFSNIDVTIPVLPSDYQSMLASITALSQEIEMQNNTINQLEAQLNSEYELSKLEAERQVTEQAAVIQVNTTQTIADYEYECTMSRQESLSLKNLSNSLLGADSGTDSSTSSEGDTSTYDQLAVMKVLDDLLNDNANVDVLIGTYEALIA